MDILEILETLKYFQDNCNTDKWHAFHTANKLKADNHPEWMVVVGLIHDIGKIIYLKGCDKDGTTQKEQWSIVGDTFATGVKIPDSMVYNEFNHVNPDQSNNTYKENCGLDKMTMSFGHDEYLYQMLMFSKNKHKLPEIALYIIRYHSLSVHHQHRAYKKYESDLDRKYLKYLQLFQKYDMKSNDTPYIDYVYYKKLIKKYFHNTFLYV
jgi:inositol oxygenase